VAALGQDNARAVVVVTPATPEMELARLHAAGARGARAVLLKDSIVPWEQLAAVAARVAPLGGHLQMQFDGGELPARAALRAGVAEGEVVGGCLSMVAAAIGTPYAPPFDGAVLFLEDTGEKAYRIDRMLVQLAQAGVLGRVAAVVFGALRPPDGSEAEHRLIGECVAEQAARLDCPVLSGIEAGHGSANFTIPFGVRARVDAAARRLSFLEPAVMV
jgi:muramoyltetrapeptide carboxypeptidase LdcA involved in peptidoglycan recycling